MRERVADLVRVARPLAGAARGLNSQPALVITLGIVVAYVCLLGGIRSLQVVAGQDGWDVAVGLLYIGALVVAQLAFSCLWALRKLPPRTAALLLAAQVALVYASVLQFSDWWYGLSGFLAGSVLLALPPVLGIPLAVAIAGSVAGIIGVAGRWPTEVVFSLATTVISTLVVYGLTRLARLVVDLQAAQEDLARMAVAGERLNFAKQLHDLLGVRLSVIMAKSSGISQVLEQEPDRGQRELGEVLVLSRKALTEVRSVASGYRQLSLAGELDSARSILAAADVGTTIEGSADELPEAVDTALATVLREGVTNVLRHSVPDHCRIVLSGSDHAASIEIVNDGVPGGQPGRSGRALAVLARRVAELGGELTAGEQAGGRFRLRATIPVGADAGAGPLVREAAGAGWSGSLPRMAPKLANAVVAVVFCGFGAMALAGALLSAEHDATAVASGVAYLVALLGLQLGYFSRPGASLRPPLSYLALLAQACLVYLPLLQFQHWWLDLPGFLAGTVLLVLPPRAGVPAAASVVLSVAWANESFGTSPLDTPSLVLSTLTTAVVVYGLSKLVRLARELHVARDELARLAVAEERLRFARDVHDLLGLGLSTITLKAELASRLLAVQPGRAREQLREIVTLARRAIGDARSVAGGYGDLSLAEELSSAESVLTSAEVAVQIERDPQALPEPVEALLATVVREGVTNVLRHAKAERCEITVRRSDHAAVLDIANDGARADTDVRDSAGSGGNGLRNLAQRVRSQSGEFAAALEDDDTFRLRASVPL